MVNYLVIDLEATTDDGADEERAVPRDEMETIEIGAVLVRANTLEVEAEFETFVKPVRHPVLTPFCTKLTGITQEVVSDAPAFPDAMEALRQAMLIGRWGVVWGVVWAGPVKSLYRCARGKPAESRPETHQRAAEALPSLSSVPSPLVHFPGGI